jgi:chromosome segregation ATPase
LTLTLEEIGKFLGQPIEDAMGRPVGKLVGLTADIKDEVTAIQVAENSGEVTQYPMNFVKLINARPTVLQSWHVEAECLRKELDIIRRRSQALELLLKDGDIDQGEYRDLRSSYEDLTEKIDAKRESLLDTLKSVEAKLEQQIRDLQTALTNNKMLYTSSEIDERTYHNVTDSIRSTLEIARKERKDLDNTREFLSRMPSTEAKPEANPTPVHTAPSSDVVVIRMKEPTEA